MRIEFGFKFPARFQRQFEDAAWDYLCSGNREVKTIGVQCDDGGVRHPSFSESDAHVLQNMALEMMVSGLVRAKN